MNWPRFVEDSLTSGAVATVATTAALVACGKAEGDTAAAPLNAVSHILWGDRAAARRDVSAKYTLIGAVLNTLAIGSWAIVYELLFGRRARSAQPAAAIVGGPVVAALAYVTDYYVVPRRLTPGFEKRLSGRSMFVVYASLAAGLTLAGLLRESRARRNAAR